MYKNILYITKNHKSLPEVELLRKHNYKVETISPENLNSIKNLLYKKNFEIILINTQVNPSVRSKIHSFLFKNFPLMLYGTVVYKIKDSCSIRKCNLHKANKCISIFINYPDQQTFIHSLKKLIKQHQNCIHGILLNSVIDLIKKFMLKSKKYFTLEKEIFAPRSFSAEYLENLISTLFENVTKKIVKLFNADKVSIFLYDTEEEKYKLISSYGFKTDDKNITVQDNWGIINYVLKNKKSLLLQNGINKYPPFRKIKPNIRINSSLVVPLLMGETIFGVMCISRVFPDKRLFLRQEHHLIEKFANWITHIYSIINGLKMMAEYEKLKSDFISIANHELRTPLMALSAALEILEKNIPLDLSQLIKRNLSRLNNLVDQLLDFARIEQNKFSINKTENSLATFIKEIIDEYQPILKLNNIKLELESKFNIDKIPFDWDRLKQVFANLINNSMKFFPKEREDKYIKISISETEKEIQFCIEDNGQGIEQQNLKKIFKPFIQLVDISHKQLPGSGLGLSITKNIIEKHNGTIWAESEYGKWTKIIFTLPKK